MNKIFSDIKGLILRESAYREDDKILTLLTAELGRISVRARRARRASSRLAAATQHLAYCDFVLFSNRAGYSLNEAYPLELFMGLRSDIGKFALAAYFAELLEAVSEEKTQSCELLSLTLNSLYALDRSLRPPELVKSVFELRAMCLSGFSPLLDACCVCGAENAESWVFGVEAGNIWCADCAKAASGDGLVGILPAELSAMRHVISAEPKKILSFALEPWDSLTHISQMFVQYHLGRGFGALDFYKKITT